MAINASLRNQIKRGFAFGGILVVSAVLLGAVSIYGPSASHYLRWHWRYSQSPQVDLDIAQDRITKFFGVSTFQLNDYTLEERGSSSYNPSFSLDDCSELRNFFLARKQIQRHEYGKHNLVSVHIVRRMRTTGVTLFISEPGKPAWRQIGDAPMGDPIYCPRSQLSAEEVRIISQLSNLPEDPPIDIARKEEIKRQAELWKSTQRRNNIEELRLVKPAYEYRKAHPDPILEAAYLFDLEKFKTLVTAAGLKQGSPAYLKKMSAALRLVAPSVEWNSSKNNGKEILNYLIQQKADPNDSLDTKPSILFLSKDSEVRKILKLAGARLTNPELLLTAIEEKDLKQIKKLLDQPNYKPYGSQSNLPTPLRTAILGLPSDTNTTTELSKNPRSEYKIVYLLITHPSKKIDLREVVVYADSVFSYVLRNNIHDVAAEYFVRDIKVDLPNEIESLLFYYIATKKGTVGFEISAELRNKIKMDLIQAKSKLKNSHKILLQFYLNSIEESDIETAELLIELGARTDQDPNQDPTILPRYLYNLESVQLIDIHRKIIRLLIKTGSKLNAHYTNLHYIDLHRGHTYYGEVSPLNYFIMNADYDLIQLALDSGASTSYATKGMCSPLATAVAKNDLKAAALLLKYKADPQVLTVADQCNEVGFPGRNLTEIKIIDMPMSSAMKELLSKK